MRVPHCTQLHRLGAREVGEPPDIAVHFISLVAKRRAVCIAVPQLRPFSHASCWGGTSFLTKSYPEAFTQCSFLPSVLYPSYG